MGACGCRRHVSQFWRPCPDSTFQACECEAACEQFKVRHNFCHIDSSYTFRQKDALGRGAFGQVFLAVNNFTGVECAVKLVTRGLANAENDVEKLREVVAMEAALQHPNVARLHETFEDDKSFYLVMDFFKGGDLAERENFTAAEKTNAARGLLQGLAHLHSRNVMHRDVKPENVMLETVDRVNVASVKIIDFGSSCVYFEGQIFSARVGTAEYMAPEVWDRRYGNQCDVWSTGVTLYHLLTGSLPYRGRCQCRHQIAREIRQIGAELSMLLAREGVSPEAQVVVNSMLQKDLNLRATFEDTLSYDWFAGAFPESPSATIHSAPACVNVLACENEEENLTFPGDCICCLGPLVDVKVSNQKADWQQIGSNEIVAALFQVGVAGG